MTRCVYLTFLGKPRGAAAGHVVHGDEEHELDEDRVLVDAGVVASRRQHADRHAGRGCSGRGKPEESRLRRPRRGSRSREQRRCARWPQPREDHESNWLITVPLVVLAVGALVAGFLQAPAFNIEKFKEWVEPAGVAVLYDERPCRAARSSRSPRRRGRGRGGRSGGGRRLRRRGPEGSACFARTEPRRVRVVEGRRVDPARPGRHRRSGLVCVALYGRRGRLLGLTERNRRAGRLRLPDQQVLPRLRTSEAWWRRSRTGRAP